MRLIDADELKAKISRSTCNYPELMWKKVTCDVINNQPTAYDIDKVVEQIKGERTCGKQEYYECLFTIDRPCDSCQWSYIEEQKAIDIIRNGGKE